MREDLDEKMATMFEGNFLDASDIQASGSITVTISDVAAPEEEKDKAGKVIDKAILTFKGAKKRLILNKTNAKIIKMAYGKKASEWIGKTITLTVRWLDKAFGQKNVPVIRVLPPEGVSLTFGMRSKYGAEKPFANN